jgi:ATP-dependent Zn protease
MLCSLPILRYQELIGHMDTAVAGRIAEEIIYGADNAETGASSDFQNLMRTAKDFVMRYGFSEKVRN